MSSMQYSVDPKLRTAQKVVFWMVVGLAGITAFGFLFGFLIQLLWNATLVPMFELPSISFWQAVGVFILAKILFGFGGGSSSNGAKKSKPDESEESDEEIPGVGFTVEVRSGENLPEEGLLDESLLDESLLDEKMGEPVEVSGLAEDEDFRKFWQAEGRDAYAAFQSRQGDVEPGSSDTD